MGFQDRDYFRDGSYTANLSAWGVDLTPVVKYLIIANVVVFLLQILLTRPAAPRLPDFDGMGADEEESARSTPPARMMRPRPSIARSATRTPARPARRWKR